MSADPENDFQSGDLDNNLLRKILARLGSGMESFTASVSEVELGDPISSAAFYGKVLQRQAFNFHVLGRRAGFNSITVLQDVGEFLGSNFDALPELTGTENLELVSGSANDSAAGTGTRAVQITYLDNSNNMVVSPSIALNGVSAVSVPFKARFIYSMESTSVGTNTVADGNILLRIPSGATQEQITAGGNRSLSSRFMVPAGYTGYINSWQVSSIGNASQDARLRATVRSGDRSLGTAYVFQDNVYVVAASLTMAVPWLICPPLCRVKISTLSGATANTNRVDCDFSILIVKN